MIHSKSGPKPTQRSPNLDPSIQPRCQFPAKLDIQLVQLAPVQLQPCPRSQIIRVVSPIGKLKTLLQLLNLLLDILGLSLGLSQRVLREGTCKAIDKQNFIFRHRSPPCLKQKLVFHPSSISPEKKFNQSPRLTKKNRTVTRAEKSCPWMAWGNQLEHCGSSETPSLRVQGIWIGNLETSKTSKSNLE